ncbi:hypothetical protein F5884DRAFT_875133, partial [Xylogone sp. PMI_703]
LFARKKFNRIVLISRSWLRLQAIRVAIFSSLSNASPVARKVEIETWAVDITETAKFQTVLKEVEQWAQKDGVSGIECVLFNAARVDFSDVRGGFEENDLVHDFKRNLMLSLRKAYPDVHIALLNVGNQVARENEHFNPDVVAGRWWDVYQSRLKASKEWMTDVNILDG